MEANEVKIRGGRPLRGEVSVRGAKNFIPKAMVASLLTAGRCILRNVADIEDVDVVSEMIKVFGGEATKTEDGIVQCQNPELRLPDFGPSRFKAIAGRSRVPILFAGPLLHRLGEVFIPGLGGCEIGTRPIDFHLKVLEALGAESESRSEGLYLRTKGLKGSRIRLGYPSVGATEQVLLTATLAAGVTELSNAAVEPEIIELAALLQKMGAVVSVEADRRIIVTGVGQLRGFDHVAPTDRLEVASWACAAAATDGEIFVSGARQADLMTFLNKFRQLGGGFEVGAGGIRFARDGELEAVIVETDVHPGFMTDWQPPFTVLLTQARGASIVHETVYENRFGYTESLRRMGANIQLHRECLGGKSCRFGRRNYLHSAVIIGPAKLQAGTIAVPDLRAGFSCVIAALTAEGTSTVKNLSTIRRGYEHFLDKLKILGAELLWD